MQLFKTLAFALIAGTMAASAAAPAPIALEPGAHHPVLSPDGTTLLFSTIDHNGLKAMDMASGDITVIATEASAGFAPVFSTDGKTVFYRTASVNDGLIYRDLRSFSLADGSRRTLAAPSRKNLDAGAARGANYAYSDLSSIRVSTDGIERDITPLADAHSYLWVSMEPGTNRIAFHEPFSGVYVANSDGSDARRVLPGGEFISWAGPNTLVAVMSEDDGHVITSSRLVAVNIATGIERTLTSDDIMVGEATAAINGLVVFSDLDGNLFSININDK